METRRKRLTWTIALAGTALACGDGSMELAGEMMKDAGEGLMEMSARMMDAGGEALRDAGQAASDAGDPVAMAQDDTGCGSCTVEGPLEVTAAISGLARTRSARDDMARVKGGFLSLDNSLAPVQVAEGPFILTHLVPSAPATAAPPVIATIHDQSCEGDRVVLAAARATTQVVQDGRFPVPAGKVLCLANDGIPSSVIAVSWSGFHPYDD